MGSIHFQTQHTMKTPNILLIFLSLAAVLCIGCTKSDNPGTVPVSVKVTQKGVPLESAAVTIFSSDGAGKASAGLTDKSGIAQLRTVESWPGAFPGEYTVAIKKFETILVESPDGDPDKASSKEVHHISKKYGDPTTSGFTLTVGMKKGDVITFDIVE